MGQGGKICGVDATPTFGHAVETFLAAHTLAGASPRTLLARSGHALVRSPARCARPGLEDVAAHLAATDPTGRCKNGHGR